MFMKTYPALEISTQFNYMPEEESYIIKGLFSRKLTLYDISDGK